MLTKSLSCNEIWSKQVPPESCTSQPPDDAQRLAASKRHRSSDKLAKPKTENHKTVIYFCDSISSKKQHNQLKQQMKAQQLNCGKGAEPMDASTDSKHAQRLCDEMVFKRQQSVQMQAKTNDIHPKCATDEVVTIVNDVKVIRNEPMNLVKHLKTVIEEKCQSKSEKPPIADNKKDESDKNLKIASTTEADGTEANTSRVEVGRKLPSFVESVVNGVINIKIDDSYDAATKLVRSIESPDTDDTDSFDAMDDSNDLFLDVGGEVNNMYLDWSFVQDWRSR